MHPDHHESDIAFVIDNVLFYYVSKDSIHGNHDNYKDSAQRFRYEVRTDHDERYEFDIRDLDYQHDDDIIEIIRVALHSGKLRQVLKLHEGQEFKRDTPRQFRLHDNGHFDITIEVRGRDPKKPHRFNCAFIAESTMKEDGKEEGDDFYDAAMDGIESFLVALAAEGMDLSNPAFSLALETTLEACAENI